MLGVDTNKNGEEKKGEFLGAFTDTLVDIQDLIDRNLDMIGTLYWLVNQIKSWLMGQATQIMTRLDIQFLHLVLVLLRLLLKQSCLLLDRLHCTFDTSLIDSLFGIIEDASMHLECCNGHH